MSTASDPQAPNPSAPRLAELADLSAAIDRAHAAALDEARRRLGRRALAGASASDVAQSAMRELIRHAARFRYYDEGTFLTLVRKLVMRNIADRVRRLRADKRDAQRTDNLDTRLQEQLGDNTPRPVSQVATAEWTEQFAAAIRRLRPLHREVLQLRLQGMTHNQIAAKLGITVENSCKSLSRARRELDDLLGGATDSTPSSDR